MLRWRPVFSLASRRLASSLVYEKHGDPLEVIQLQQSPPLSDRLTGKQVRLQILGAPINPADINQIQGVYPVKPPLPAVGGNEGVARVVDVGPDVSTLVAGDHVIPAQSGFGMWREEAVAEDEELLFRIDSRLPIEFASTLQVNPCTAYRMLTDFVRLKPGEFVVQNGANSAVGRYVIQIAKIFGLQTVNIVRDRPGIDDLKKDLTSLGATLVYTEEEFGKVVRDVKSRLALNCVGGRSSFQIARTLQREGVMVTYGGMSKQPVQGATGPFIFNDVIFRGFWMSYWYELSKKDPEKKRERAKMYNKLAQWIIAGHFATPKLVRRQLGDYQAALTDAIASADAKQIFVFGEK